MSRNILHNLTMRPADGQDAVSLTDLALRSKAYWGYSAEFMAACRAELTFTPEQFAAPQTNCHICRENERPIAFYVLEKTGADIAELDALFVDPDYIGKGIGKMLIRHAKVQAAEIGVSTIVIQGDAHAERFYVALGAMPCGTRESGSIPGSQLPLFKIKLSD